jgi:hypothetical protein
VPTTFPELIRRAEEAKLAAERRRSDAENSAQRIIDGVKRENRSTTAEENTQLDALIKTKRESATR